MSKYIASIGKILAGNGAAQVLPLIFAPLLTRIYSPADFGVFGVISGVAIVVSAVVCAKLDVAIIGEKTHYRKSLLAIVATGALIACTITFIIVGVVLFYVGVVSAELMLLTVIYSTALGGFNIYNNLAISLGFISFSAKLAAVRGLMLIVIQILMGLSMDGYYGLVFGSILSTSFVAVYCSYRLPISFNRIDHKRKVLMHVFISNIGYVKYSIVATIANRMVVQFLSIFSPYFFGYTVAGQINLVSRLLNTPIALISGAVSQIFYKTISQNRDSRKKRQKYVILTVLSMSLISLVGYLAVIYFSKYFVVVFGNDWDMASEIVFVIAPMFFIRMTVNSVSTIIYAMKRLVTEVVVNVILLIGALAVFAIFRQYFEYLELLSVYSMVLSVLYVLIGSYFVFLGLQDEKEDKTRP